MSATYNDAGRVKTISNSGVTETLVYNALGQRVQRTGGSVGTVLYAYDEAGHVLGEYDGTGALIEETVWLRNIPVATLRPHAGGIDIFYVHTDQLNTPRAVTRPSDNMLMWTWYSDPFGTDAANENPAGAGAFKYNVRFAGQLFDGQAGLHANGYRDCYDPALGRYCQPDPIGLVGGSLSLYAYAGGNPLSRIDPSGLSSIDAEIADAIASGNLEALESLLEGADSTQADLIRAAIERWNSTADQLISKECQARVRGRFPKSVLNNTLKEIQELAREGEKVRRLPGSC